MPHPLRLFQTVRRRSRRGQVAVSFIVFMALMLVLGSATMNLGEIARLKTATANAADAGALASASWVASGTNELARIADGMLTVYQVVQGIFFVPFCLQLIWLPPVLLLTLITINYYTLKLMTADPMIHVAWDNAKGDALFTAIQNLRIDDDTGQVDAKIKQLADAFDDTREITSRERFEWVRKGVMDEPSWVEIDVNFPPDALEPELTMDGGSLFWWYWVPSCIPPFLCWPAWGWKAPGEKKTPPESPKEPQTGKPSTQGKSGGQWIWWVKPVFSYKPRLPGFCGYPTFIPWFVPAGWILKGIPIRPRRITNSRQRIRVNVTQHREGGSPLTFWKMDYPDRIDSRATAEYGGAAVCGGLFGGACDNAVAQLQSVDQSGPLTVFPP